MWTERSAEISQGQNQSAKQGQEGLQMVSVCVQDCPRALDHHPVQATHGSQLDQSRLDESNVTKRVATV